MKQKQLIKKTYGESFSHFIYEQQIQLKAAAATTQPFSTPSN
jgi:hypothetical protein